MESDSDEESESESLGEFQRKATEISSERVSEATKKNYASKLKAWKRWMKAYKPESLNEEEELILPLAKENMLLFLGSIVYKDAAKTKRIANSTMMGYYSALKYHYSERERCLLTLQWNYQIFCQVTKSKQRELAKMASSHLSRASNFFRCQYIED
jgi:hypothetical protein